ncbi:MAG: helix-turn-helix transcriptional regulator [Deltaproteobacteria bacterium]|nr:helix-turn-helix transcriptional regulator [Deltaproteobacteria bacterium]
MLAQSYRHFCPVARAIEKIGDKWSLLIIRDLLREPQRFTDLIGSLSNITPKWLTQRLRDLEAAGIVKRDKKPGRREVWYDLTPAGRELGPVIEALMVWGFRWAMRPPVPGEVVHPDLMMRGLTFSLNKRGKQPAQTATWAMRFPQATYALSFDGEGWTSRKQDDSEADVTVTTTPEIWATVFSSPRSERSRLAETLQIEGAPENVAEFMNIFGIQHKGTANT